jgi:biopolymer transport protein TolR
MGISLETGGRRSSGFDLNLVPFIDLLSVNITFLLVTAVWSELGDVPLEQRVGAGGVSGGPPPITVSVRPDGITVLRSEPDRVLLGVSNGFAWDDLGREFDARVTPGERRVNLCVSDGLPYEVMIRALDVARARGLEEAALCEG